jgi:hypothetical protein
MPSTYEPIATNTLGSATGTITFSSIPSTFTDLILLANGNSSTLVDTYLRFNNDSTSGLYSTTRLYGNGSTAASDRPAGQTNQILAGDFSTSSNTITIIQINNYSNTTTNKTALIRANIANSIVFANVGLWRNNNAISTVSMSTSSGTFSIGSTFTLYGIKAA